jgi:3-dehydroquinate synthase
MLKMALVADASLFELLRLHGPSLIATGFASPHGTAEHAILRSIDLMLSALAPNLFEDQTLERVVDFGHTFSPVLEELSGYELRHGEAVAIDMAVSAAVAEQLGLLDSATCDLVLSAIRRLGLPSWHPVVSQAALARGLAAATRHRDGRPNLVVPVDLGEVTFLRDLHEIPLPALGGALDRVREANVDVVVAPVGAPSV